MRIMEFSSKFFPMAQSANTGDNPSSALDWSGPRQDSFSLVSRVSFLNEIADHGTSRMNLKTLLADPAKAWQNLNELMGTWIHHSFTASLVKREKMDTPCLVWSENHNIRQKVVA